MDPRILLFYLIAFAGFVMVVGGMCLLYQQKIYIDRESQQPVEIELPGKVKLKTNYPALVLFFLGIIALMYPIHELAQLQQYQRVAKVRLTGAATTNVYPALIYAAIAPPSPSAITRDGDSFSFSVPFIGNGDQQYKVLLIVNDHVLDTQTVKDEGGVDQKIVFRSATLPVPDYQVPEGSLLSVPAAYKQE